MRSLTALGACMAILGACAAPQEAPDWEAQIRAANDVLLNQGELDRVPELFAASYVSHGVDGDARGHEAISGFLSALRLYQQFPGRWQPGPAGFGPADPGGADR